MKLFSCLFLVFIYTTLSAQNKFEFHSQNYVGMLEGETSAAAQIQTINGFQRKTWFAGLGTGLDYYYFRSVPLFFSLNKSFCACERTFFLSLDGGYHWIWDKQTGNAINGWRNGDFRGAPYWAAGLGYRIGLKNKKDAILLNAGFSAKNVREEIKVIWPCLREPCPVNTDRIRYKLNRLSLRVGWQF